MVQIFGPDERPIDLSKLREEQAGPTLTGVRQIVSGHPAQGLTPARLASLLREAEQGDPTRYLELAEEMEEKDLHYLAVLGTRKRAVCQLEITVEPASDNRDDIANAELVEDFLNREEIEDELVDILDAIGKGFSAIEIIWDVSERQWMPQRLEWRYPHWFEFDRTDGRTLRLRGEAGPEPLAPFKFITHFPKIKSGLPIRGGLARAAAWGYLFKNYDIKDWVTFIEIYGQPLRVGKYHPGATEDDKKVLLKAVANLGTDAAAIIPNSMLIEFVKAEQRGSSDLYEKFAEYIDKQISKAVLGQTLTTEVSEGSRAAAQVHDEVRGDIERADSKQLAARLNCDLVRPIVDLNRGPQKVYPRIVIGRPEQVDVPELTDSVSKLVPLGLPVGKEEMRRKIGLGELDKAADLLIAPQAAPPPQAPPGTAEAAARRGGVGLDDSIDDLAEQILADDGWEALMAPLVEDVRRILRESRTLQEARDRLAEILGEDNTGTFVGTLTKALFQGRLAGETGAAITDDDPNA
ncbi:MAG: DUF935 domain-containing protein [Kiloniellaceae bacterium]